MFYYKMDHMAILSIDKKWPKNFLNVTVKSKAIWEGWQGHSQSLWTATQWWWQSCAFVSFSTGSFSTVFANTDSGDDSVSVHLVWVDWFNLWSHWHLAPSHTCTFTSINTLHIHLHSVKPGTHLTLAFALEFSNTGGKRHQWRELPYMWGILQY